MAMTTTISRFAVVTLVSLSFLANICIAIIQPYIIYPAPNIDQAACKALSNTIGVISTKSYNYTRWEKTIPEFWVAWLRPADYILIKNDRRIKEVHLSKVLAKPAVSVESTSFNISSPVEAPSEVEVDISVGSNPSYTTQSLPAATDLRVLSQPPGFLSWSQYENFVYTTAGAGTYIYHAELGVTPGLDVHKSRIEWLYTPAVIFSGKAKQGESMGPGLSFGHSTCTASKAAGIACGAAKEAKLVVVKMLDYSEPSLVSVFEVIADDVKQKGRGGKSVVSVSWTTIAPIPAFSEDPWFTAMRDALEELYKNNVIVVCSAGNFALLPFRGIVDTAPAIFVDLVITVGASYFNGHKWKSSQSLGVLPQLYAPGVGILCADASGRVAYRKETGTSFSSPLVAGIIAGFLARGQIPFPLDMNQLMTFLYNKASWRRGSNGQHVIWNQVDMAHNAPKSTPKSMLGNATVSNLTASGSAMASNLTASFLEINGPGNGQFNVSTD